MATNLIPGDMLLAAYAHGLFPMSPNAHSNTVDWIEPRWRGVIPMDDFRVSKNVQRWVRNHPHSVYVNRDFERVVEFCRQRKETWISPLIIQSYSALQKEGHAHSVEVYDSNDVLVGGLYGVSLCGAFFGESMFKRAPEMDKVALLYCHHLLQHGGFCLWDTQFYTDHLGTFGCKRIPQKQYLELLSRALEGEGSFAQGKVTI